MDEMLGNHYFLARNYARAAELLEKALRAEPKSKPIRRKLIISHSQTGQVDKALAIFLSLIKEDIDFIINTDPVDDDCPCPELVFELEKQQEENKQSLDFLLIMGMMWLYCNIHKSYQYFGKAADLDRNNSSIKSILALLNARLAPEKTGV